MCQFMTLTHKTCACIVFIYSKSIIYSAKTGVGKFSHTIHFVCIYQRVNYMYLQQYIKYAVEKILIADIYHTMCMYVILTQTQRHRPPYWGLSTPTPLTRPAHCFCELPRSERKPLLENFKQFIYYQLICL